MNKNRMKTEINEAIFNDVTSEINNESRHIINDSFKIDDDLLLNNKKAKLKENEIDININSDFEKEKDSDVLSFTQSVKKMPIIKKSFQSNKNIMDIKKELDLKTKLLNPNRIKEENKKIFYPFLMNKKKGIPKSIVLKMNNNDNNKEINVDEIDKSKEKEIEIKRRDNILTNGIFKTAINNKTSLKRIRKGNRHYKTEANFRTKKKNEENKNVFVNNSILKLKKYQKKMEFSYNKIRKRGNNINKDINNNPFMRKIENLNNINEFEIIFKNSIMRNIKEIQKDEKIGFFLGECCGVNTNKDKSGGYYVCENRANIYNISEMIDRMNPLSIFKFSELLRRDYKEFLDYNRGRKKKKIKKEDDRLRKKIIKRYNKELFYQNEIADKFQIKKNSGIKFLTDDDDEQNNIKKIKHNNLIS